MKPPEAQTARALAVPVPLAKDQPPRKRRFRRHPAVALKLLPDEQLARLASRGDRAAFAAIFDRYHQPLFRYCTSILRDVHDAADAVQTAMLNALRSLEGDEREIALRPWLYRIALNESIALLRRRPTNALEDVPAQLDMEADLELRERFDELLADMQQLPERQRGALAMRELAGLAYADIAVALDTSPTAAKQAIYEARRALHELARGREMACDAIRGALADGDGRSLRGRAIRAHLRACRDCRELRETTERRRSRLAAFAPTMPAFTARQLARGLGFAGGGALAEGALVTGGLPAGIKALTALVAGLAATAVTGAGSGTAAVEAPSTSRAHVPVATTAEHRNQRGVSHHAGAQRTAGRRHGTSHRSGAGAPGERSSASGRTRHVVRLEAGSTAPRPGGPDEPAGPSPSPPGAGTTAPSTGSHPVREALPPRREDPGPVRTTVQNVTQTTTSTVQNVTNTATTTVQNVTNTATTTVDRVRDALPPTGVLPKRRVARR